jgi:lysophospholipase L1-like esterase
MSQRAVSRGSVLGAYHFFALGLVPLAACDTTELGSPDAGDGTSDAAVSVDAGPDGGAHPVDAAVPPSCCTPDDPDSSVDAAHADAGIDAGVVMVDAGLLPPACATTDAGPASALDFCALRPSQVVLLGDSYFAREPISGEDREPFRQNLEALARSAGQLAGDAHYRDHSASWAFMTPGIFQSVPAVPQQYRDACLEDPDIGWLILNGGGNDILVGNRLCLTYATPEELAADPSCVASIDHVIEQLTALLDSAFARGTQGAVFVWYAHFRSSFNSGPYPSSFLDYAAPRLEAACAERADARCRFVDVRAAFDRDGDGETDAELVHSDGVHPSAAGSELLAQEVWNELAKHCGI